MRTVAVIVRTKLHQNAIMPQHTLRTNIFFLVRSHANKIQSQINCLNNLKNGCQMKLDQCIFISIFFLPINLIYQSLIRRISVNDLNKNCIYQHPMRFTIYQHFYTISNVFLALSNEMNEKRIQKSVPEKRNENKPKAVRRK